MNLVLSITGSHAFLSCHAGRENRCRATKRRRRIDGIILVVAVSLGAAVTRGWVAGFDSGRHDGVAFEIQCCHFV